MFSIFCLFITNSRHFTRPCFGTRTIVMVNRIHGVFHLLRSYSTDNICKIPSADVARYIKDNTEISRSHLTPEIGLHLITPNCKLWTARADDVIVPDPFWAFYWPGGQALTRFILDNSNILRDKNVLDVGSGCGASAIASAMSGAKHVVANDICQVACEAIKLNAELNQVSLDIDRRNLIGFSADQWDVVLLGDMFYDEEFTKLVADWLDVIHGSEKVILIGDPGRASFVSHPVTAKLKNVAQYELHSQCKIENNGLTHGYVWQYTS